MEWVESSERLKAESSTGPTMLPVSLWDSQPQDVSPWVAAGPRLCSPRHSLSLAWGNSSGSGRAGTPAGSSSCRGGTAQAGAWLRAACSAALPSPLMGSTLGSVSAPWSYSHHLHPGSSLPLALWLGVLFEVNTQHTSLPRAAQCADGCKPLPYSLYTSSAFPLSCLLSSVRLGNHPSYVSVLAECLAL